MTQFSYSCFMEKENIFHTSWHSLTYHSILYKDILPRVASTHIFKKQIPTESRYDSLRVNITSYVNLIIIYPSWIANILKAIYKFVGNGSKNKHTHSINQVLFQVDFPEHGLYKELSLKYYPYEREIQSSESSWSFTELNRKSRLHFLRGLPE